MPVFSFCVSWSTLEEMADSPAKTRSSPSGLTGVQLFDLDVLEFLGLLEQVVQVLEHGLVAGRGTLEEGLQFRRDAGGRRAVRAHPGRGVAEGQLGVLRRLAHVLDRLAVARDLSVDQVLDLLLRLLHVAGHLAEVAAHDQEIAVVGHLRVIAAQVLELLGLAGGQGLEVVSQLGRGGQRFLVRLGLVLVRRQLDQPLQQLVGRGFVQRRIEHGDRHVPAAGLLVQVEQVAHGLAAFGADLIVLVGLGEDRGDADVLV
jgi:hypothetical protein